MENDPQSVIREKLHMAIKVAMVRQGYTAKSLGEAMELSPSRVSYMLTRSTGITSLSRIAKFLGVEVTGLEIKE